ncbi:hypothetical protein PENNAL_c0048G09527 [Penicillium nalgiovense]|uniref:Uncharacterized protein n=1 Tax=Penicillium nalgiovense TaxID=60175 RepID=A0A1V6XYA3_PENNA|nr:hypothetical protein PENNAL_c0048G09527 [Penicillium nalgiovense]
MLNTYSHQSTVHSPIEHSKCSVAFPRVSIQPATQVALSSDANSGKRSDHDHNTIKEVSPSKTDGTPASTKTHAKYHKPDPERTSRATISRARTTFLSNRLPSNGAAMMVPHHHRAVLRPRRHPPRVTLSTTNFTYHHSPHSSSRTQSSPVGTLAGCSGILASTPMARGYAGQSGVGPGSWETLCTFTLLSVLNQYRNWAWLLCAHH